LQGTCNNHLVQLPDNPFPVQDCEQQLARSSSVCILVYMMVIITKGVLSSTPLIFGFRAAN